MDANGTYLALLGGGYGGLTGSGAIVYGTAPTIATPNITGKYDLNNVAVDDDDCTGEQGKGWYDTTDSAWEFCNANSGAPTTLGGGSGVGFWWGGSVQAGTVPASSSRFLVPGFSSTLGASETTMQWIAPANCTVRDFYIQNAVSAQPADGTLVLTVRDDASDTALVITITNAGGTQVWSNTSDTPSIAAGSQMSIRVTNNSASTSTNLYDWGMRCAG